MKISEYFNLGVTQRQLDFVDIDVDKDTPLFIDPFLLSKRRDTWSYNANATIQNFFQHIIDLIRNKQVNVAKELFDNLHEPQETHLGLSEYRIQGRGVGPTDTAKMFKKILQSNAIQSGLVEDLQDSSIFVENIGKDKLSDMATNIMRKHLVEYTQQQCVLWDIPLIDDVPSGVYWDRHLLSFENELVTKLIVNDQPVLLVPKAIVSYKFSYTPEKFYRHFVLHFLQQEHLRLNTSLVQTTKPKKGLSRKFVTKKSIIETEAPYTREYLRTFTKKHPNVLEDFRKALGAEVKPLDLQEFESFSVSKFSEFLIAKLNGIRPGTDTAEDYHNFTIGALDFLFYPSLICPRKERPIHEGRKRIDLTFENAAGRGFFHRLHNVKKIPSQYIFVECKNYTGDPKNPELDQLSGRFSPNRGKFGLLLCRSLKQEKLFLKRCADTYHDDRGLIIPITDLDLIHCLNELQQKRPNNIETILSSKMEEVILR